MAHEGLDALFNTAPIEDETPIEGEMVPASSEVAKVQTVPDVPTPSATDSPVIKHNEDLQDDVDYARNQIKSLIDQSRRALQGALELAEAGEKPSAYQVVGELIQATVAANKELINIHKTKKDAEKPVAGGSTTTAAGDVTIEKAVFIGRASDLLRELKKTKKAINDGA